MKPSNKTKILQSNPTSRDLLALKPGLEPAAKTEGPAQLIGKRIICRTDYLPVKRTPLEIVVDATEGFIPLWAENLVLRWKFNAPSFAAFQHADSIQQKIRDLLASAITAWGDAAPIRFTEESDNADFDIVMKKDDDCDQQGCVLAQGFFPDGGRHQLFVYPKMFTQTQKEQVETLEHEIGHVFGLRHFFAPDQEAQWPSEIFGKNRPFSIMNYGEKSHLTAADKSDLKKLYKAVWAGQLTRINSTPFKLVQPFHYLHS